jgi:hypothetical protein
MQPIQALGHPWFDEDDYPSFRAILPDRSWHATYHHWLAAAEQTVQRLEHSGMRVVKVKVRSHAFAQWCRDTGRAVDSGALVQFANEVAYRVLTNPQPQ